MGKGAGINSQKKMLTSQDNIIIKANRDLLQLTGYTESELVGKTLEEANDILRIGSQVNLEGVEDDVTIFLFTKELLAIEVTISCEIINKGVKRLFSFRNKPNDLIMEKFNVVNQLGISRGDGVAIVSFPNLILINSNQNYLNFLPPPFNEKIHSIGKDIMKVSPEYLESKFNSIKDHIINTGTSYHMEEVGIGSMGLGESYWNISLVPIFEEEIIKYVILSLSNVTEMVLNRIAIKQRKEELEVVIENISDRTIIFDKDFNITYSSKEIDKYSPINNQYLHKLTHIAKHRKVFDKNDKLIAYENLPFQRVARGEFVSNYIIKLNNSSEEVHMEVNGSPIYDMNGNWSGGVMVYTDIGDRIRQEEARLIETQKEILTKVVDALDLEFVRCSYPDLEILSINNTGINILKEINNGIQAITCPIRKNYFEIYPINEEVKRKEIELYLIERGYYTYTDYKDYHVEGKEMFFKTINQPILGFDNKIVEIIFITIDITNEMEERNKMEETLEMQNQLFATISHELKTPLSLIFSASQLVERHLKNEIKKINKEEIGKNINTIKQNYHRFSKLINNIIDLSSIEFGFYNLNFTNRNIIEIVEGIVDSVGSYVEQRGLRVIFDTDTEEKIMAVDVDKLERIILNLISNAVKFSPKYSRIDIEIKDKGDFIDILVRDYGMGIDKNHLNTIFDKYKKLDISLNRNAEGSGIGLALVKTMVELIDGEISVESKLGEGSLFTISLPVMILDNSEIACTMEESESRIDKIDIEFSDVYLK